MKYSYGYNLLELMAACAMVAVLTMFAVTSYSDLVLKLKMNAHAHQLQQYLNTARAQAISSRLSVTVCPSNDDTHCSDRWASSYLVFIDSNANRTLDNDEPIIHQQAVNRDLNIHWRAFQNKTALRWLATGYTASQNGSFVLCPRNGNLHYARAVILTKTGRTRLSVDSNKDGIDEGADGKALSC